MQCRKQTLKPMKISINHINLYPSNIQVSLQLDTNCELLINMALYKQRKILNLYLWLPQNTLWSLNLIDSFTKLIIQIFIDLSTDIKNLEMMIRSEFTWKSLETISSCRDTLFRHLKQLYNLGPPKFSIVEFSQYQSMYCPHKNWKKKKKDKWEVISKMLTNKPNISFQKTENKLLGQSSL